MSKKTILTGIRANGELHLGVYLGAIEPMIRLQKEHVESDTGYQLNFFVPDLHSFTTPIDHSSLQSNIINNLKIYAAAGLDLDNDRTFIYRQSYVPAHSELAWILDCFTYFGEASRMTEFKDKSERVGQEVISVGQFNYPVLMAADILLYGAEWVPVGEDQRQHIEITRVIAERINKKFGDVFVVPHETAKQVEFAGRQKPVRIRSLRNPDKKMSKSIDDPAGTILLTDSAEAATKKVMSATTDSEANINFNFETQPGISNLLQILALLTNRPQEVVNEEWIGKSDYGSLKSAVAIAVAEFLTDFQSRLKVVDSGNLHEKLDASEIAMNKTANETLLRVQKAVGLR